MQVTRLHPGTYVRRNVIPKEMSITKASELLGVGRPALSNFLNGKSSLSLEMSLRLERVFDVDSRYLLDLQAQFSQESKAEQLSIVTGNYSITLISIKAIEIEQWADKIESRTKLAALLRLLIQSTGEPTFCDFPAYENAELPGWDGITQSESATSWIPFGFSGWEFGCSKDPARKAEEDYSKRMLSVSPDERKAITFIFVTPRNWTGKNEWVREKLELRHWKDVRVYDANNLEQWIENSARVQFWFAEELGKHVRGLRLLSQCWSQWADSCEPKLTQAIFKGHVQIYSENFQQWLKDSPKKPYVVAAESRDEALAFLYCLIDQFYFNSDSQKIDAMVVDSPEAFEQMKYSGYSPNLFVINHSKIENEIGGFFRRCHCVIIRPSNDLFKEPNIRLKTIRKKEFEFALSEMNFTEDEIDKLSRESACSPSILRRLLSEIPEISTPHWSKSDEVVRKLMPAALVGAWQDDNEADQEVVRCLAKADNYKIVESNTTELLALNDSPLWLEREYCGVASRIETLKGIACSMSKEIVDGFFVVAEIVLSERDPTIGLAGSERWAAIFEGKVRSHSDVLRNGILETLILFAIFGEQFFEVNFRTQIDFKNRVDRLIRKLFTPFDRDTVASQIADLPSYAEASPEVILELIENDLNKCKPTLFELLRPAEGTVFNRPYQVDVLRALECLAWNASYFPRIVDILTNLFELQESFVKDIWKNTPENTLHSLFRSWLPMTNASTNARIRVFETLCEKSPILGWNLCLMLLNPRKQLCVDTCRPRWRNDAENLGRKQIDREQCAFFISKVKEIVFSWPQHDNETLADLVDILDTFETNEQYVIWSLVDNWTNSSPSEDAKAHLRKHIHRLLYSRKKQFDGEIDCTAAQTAFEKLRPTDPVSRHAWLFESKFVDLQLENATSEYFDKYEQQLRKRRQEALFEIWKNRGFEGVTSLLSRSHETAQQIGELVAQFLKKNDNAISIIEPCLIAAEESSDVISKNFLAGFICGIRTEERKRLINSFKYQPNLYLTLLLCLPYRRETWNLLEDTEKQFRDNYWRKVEPPIFPNQQNSEEINFSIDRLLDVNRAETAFHSVHLLWEKVDTSRIIKLLHALYQRIKNKSMEVGALSHYLSVVFDELDNRGGTSTIEKAELEFAFFPLLQHTEHGIPNLEFQIAKSHDLFVFAIRCAFKRSDGVDDWNELGFVDLDHFERISANYYELFYRLRRIPGKNDQGFIDLVELKRWLYEVRKLLQQYDRITIGDLKIGEYLANSPSDSDGIWPCRPVCEALDEIASEQIIKGFILGLKHLRGAHVRQEGGNQEREVAAQFRVWARERSYEFPYIERLLNEIAASYENEAKWWDHESRMENWLR